MARQMTRWPDLGAVVVVTGTTAIVMTGDWAARSTSTRVGVSPTPARSPTCSVKHSGILGSLFAIVLLMPRSSAPRWG